MYHLLKHEMNNIKLKFFQLLYYGNKINNRICHFPVLNYISCLVYCVLQNGLYWVKFPICTIAYNPPAQRLCGLVSTYLTTRRLRFLSERCSSLLTRWKRALVFEFSNTIFKAITCADMLSFIQPLFFVSREKQLRY